MQFLRSLAGDGLRFRRPEEENYGQNAGGTCSHLEPALGRCQDGRVAVPTSRPRKVRAAPSSLTPPEPGGRKKGFGPGRPDATACASCFFLFGFLRAGVLVFFSPCFGGGGRPRKKNKKREKETTKHDGDFLSV